MAEPIPFNELPRPNTPKDWSRRDAEETYQTLERELAQKHDKRGHLYLEPGKYAVLTAASSTSQYGIGINASDHLVLIDMATGNTADFVVNWEDVDGLEAQLVALETAYEDADATLTAAVAVNASAIATNEGAIATLETEIEAARDGEVSLLAQINSIQSAIVTNETAISSVETEITAARDGEASLNAKLTSIETAFASADSAIASDVTALEARVTTTEGDISTNAAAITTEATARASGDSANATSIETLEAYVGGPSPNLMPNSNFELGEDGWTTTYGSATYNVNGAYWSIGGLSAGTYTLGYSPGFDVVSSGSYSFSFEQNPTLTGSANLRCDLECYDSEGGSLLGRVGLNSSTATGWERVKSEGISLLSGTTWARLRWYINDGEAGNAVRIRRAKVERNATATAYSDDADNYARGAYVTTLKEAFVDSNGDAIAQFVVEASAGGGDPARIGLRDGSGGSSIALVAEQIFFGSDTVFEDTYNTLYTEDGGGYRLRILGPFPASGDLVIWYGADSVALNSETKTNGIFALATDGKVYFGSADLSTEVGNLKAIANGASWLGTAGSGRQTGNMTCTVTNGSGSQTYRWSSDDSNVSFTSPTAATTKAQRDISVGVPVEAVCRCLVTDGTESVEAVALATWDPI